MQTFPSPPTPELFSHQPPPRADGRLPITITHLEMVRADWTERGRAPEIDVPIEHVRAPTAALLSRALRPRRPALAVVRAPAAERCRSADAARPAGSRAACRPPRRRPGRLLRTGRRRARLLRPDAPLHRPAHRPVAARPRHRARLRPRHRADRPQHQHARPSQGARHLSQGRVSPGAQRKQGIARSARAVAGGLSLAAEVRPVP